MLMEEEILRAAETLNAMDVPKRSEAEIKMLAEAQMLREALEKLSPEDRASYERDFHAYGNAMIHQRDDGTVAYVPMEDWPDASVIAAALATDPAS